MRLFLKGILFLGVIIALLIGGFSLYAHFIMDYSLDNLAFAVSVTQKESAPDKLNPLAQQVYHSVVEDLKMQEAAQENADLKNLVLLDLASRSFEEVSERAGYARAKVYLNQIAESKKPKREPFLLWMDHLTKKAFDLLESVSRFLRHALGSLKKQGSAEKIGLKDYAGTLLLSRAQEEERDGDWDAAALDYRKYLKTYAAGSDRGLATISYANILIKQRRYPEASKFLEELQLSSFGTQEGDLASKLLRKIASLRDKEKLIEDLEKLKEKETNPAALEKIQFRLALAYLATNQWKSAQVLFASLEKAENKKIRDKAGFYLGWIYKLQEDYTKSAEVFLKLLQDPQLKTDLELGLRAQLADIYYKTGNVDQSLSQYQIVSEKAKASRNPNSPEAVHAAWLAFSELEQANIYYFDVRDVKRAKDHLNTLGSDTNAGINFQDLEFRLQESARVRLRDLAFEVLISHQSVERALDLFSRDLDRHPNDPLTLGGLATVYTLMGDLETAHNYAERAYQINPTEYTTSMLAYVEGLQQNFQDSIQKYQEVLYKNPGSIPAKFNMAFMYLRLKDYKSALDLLTSLDQALNGKTDKKYVRSKTLNNLGYAYWGLGNDAKAVQQFREALKLSPHFNLAQQNLDRISSGRIPKAARLTE